MSDGKLQINVFNETVGLPIENAKITISRSDGNKDLISELITNSSGKSDVIILETPPLDYSLTSNMPKPYSEYDINIKKENFDDITIEKVQILPDSTAQQNVYMKKLKNENINYEIFDIPPHTLYGEYPPKISEDIIKPLPSTSGFVVLDRVVIPEYIIVHDGDPNDDSAPNYWIPYKDYIKNVASSEIYATWPKEAIKANILTINSFTLNRVYTEWYRSKGKNFTVTSSTAYDQKFVYQRNIFQEISNLVDELFSTYITKPQIAQPLFTQYCDGKNVTCPGWLSQWGTTELAKDGLDYMDILRNYYGNDIYLESATQISGIPVSFPGETIQIGSTGNAVKTIQSQLNEISNKYPAIEKVAVDGIYGQKTLEAVKKFQNTFDLPETGYVDYATWYSISSVYTAVKKLA